MSGSVVRMIVHTAHYAPPVGITQSKLIGQVCFVCFLLLLFLVINLKSIFIFTCFVLVLIFSFYFAFFY